MLNIEKLSKMLEYKRPAFSKTEEEFIDRFIMSVDGARKDAFGNIIVDRGDPSILFSAHTDTVDHVDGKRDILIDANNDVMYAHKDILGADDGAGCYLMLEMIDAGVEGRYVFHRAEEHGGIGANWILQNTPELLHPVKAAIAFDRMGDTDVIDHMITGTTCSNAFSSKLCSMLSPRHKQAVGSFTDTAFYVTLIENCTNISIGYYAQHTNDEFLDLLAFDEIVEKSCKLDWKQLIL